MSDVQSIDLIAIGARIRAAREQRGLKTLDQFADRIFETGCDRPSLAKLSRLETGDQPVPLDILPAVSSIVGIPAQEIRPDLAAQFTRQAEAAE